MESSRSNPCSNLGSIFLSLQQVKENTRTPEFEHKIMLHLAFYLLLFGAKNKIVHCFYLFFFSFAFISFFSLCVIYLIDSRVYHSSKIQS